MRARRRPNTCGGRIYWPDSRSGTRTGGTGHHLPAGQPDGIGVYRAGVTLIGAKFIGGGNPRATEK